MYGERSGTATESRRHMLLPREMYGKRSDTAIASRRHMLLSMRASPQSGPMPLGMRGIGSVWGGRCNGIARWCFVVVVVCVGGVVRWLHAVAAAGVCGCLVVSGRAHRGVVCLYVGELGSSASMGKEAFVPALASAGRG